MSTLALVDLLIWWHFGTAYFSSHNVGLQEHVVISVDCLAFMERVGLHWQYMIWAKPRNLCIWTHGQQGPFTREILVQRSNAFLKSGQQMKKLFYSTIEKLNLESFFVTSIDIKYKESIDDIPPSSSSDATISCLWQTTHNKHRQHWQTHPLNGH